MRIIVHREALRELDDTIAFYEEQRPGLGVAFGDDVDSGLTHILEYPQAAAPYLRGSRRYILPRFPFGIVYLLDGDLIVVFAFMHHSRDPEYWLGRTP